MEAVGRQGHVPHPRRDEVVRRRAGDVRGRRASRGASRWPRSRTTRTSASGYLDPNVKDAGVTKIECPDADTFVAYTTDQSRPDLPDLRPDPAQARLRQVRPTRRSPTQKFDPPLVGTGPYTLVEWKTGQFARFARNPNYWGTKGFADEVVLRFFPDATDAWSRRSSRASSTTPTTSTRTSSSSSSRPGLHGGRGQVERLDPDRVQHLRHRHRQDDQGRRPVDQGAARPGVPRRPRATRSTSRRSSTACSAASGTSAPPIVPPVLVDWHVEPTTPRTLRHRARQAEARRGRLSRSTRTASASTRRASRSPCASSTPTRTTATRSPPSSSRSGTAQLGIDVNVQSLRQRHRSRTSSCRPRPDGKADYDIELWGWVGQPGPERPAHRLPLRPDRQPRRTASTATRSTTSCTTSSRREAGDQRHATLAKMQNLIYDDAPYDILYYDSNLRRLSERQVRRLAEHAGRWHAVLHLRHVLNYTLLTDATAQPSATAEAAVPSASTGASAAPRRADARPERGARPGSSTSGGGSNTTPPCGRGRVIVVVVVAGGPPVVQPTPGGYRRGRIDRSPGMQRHQARVAVCAALAGSPGAVTGERSLHSAQAARGARHDRGDRGPQLRAVPDDARLAGARDRRTRISRPRSWRPNGRSGASTSRCSRTSWSRTSRRPSQGDLGLLDQVPRPARDGSRARRGRPDGPAHRAGRGDRDRPRAVARGALRLATRRRRSTGSATRLSLIFYSMPYFVIGMPLIIIFAAGLGWFPTSGMPTPGGDKTPIEAAVRPRAPPRAAARPPSPLGLIGGVLDPDALVDHRHAVRGLHHDRPGQGPARRRGSCARTPFPTRCCQWSR